MMAKELSEYIFMDSKIKMEMFHLKARIHLTQLVTEIQERNCRLS